MNNGAYFDYNATTPICQEARAAIIAALDSYANPSAAYRSAGRSKSLLAECRKRVAALINAEPEQIFFTSGGTESNNWIINTVLGDLAPEVAALTSAIEHESVLATLENLRASQGRRVTRIAPGKDGIVDTHQIAESIHRQPPGFMTCMYANNETGAIQPVAEIGQLANEAGIFFHVDAVQAVGKVPVDVQAIGCDSLSLSAHKFHGPKGVGALYVRDPERIAPWIHGGAQERGFRSGTENLQGLAGMGAAAQVAKDQMSESMGILSKTRKELLAHLDMAGIRYSINSPGTEHCLPNTVNLSIFGVRAEALAAYLSLKYDIEVSIGSACGNNKKRRQSHVLQAMGLDEQRINGAIRISFGKQTGAQDLERLVDGLSAALGHLTDLAATG